MHVFELVKAIRCYRLGGRVVHEGGRFAELIWDVLCLRLLELLRELLGVWLARTQLAPSLETHQLYLVHRLLLAGPGAHRRLLPQAVRRELVARALHELITSRGVQVVLSVGATIGDPRGHQVRACHRLTHDARAALVHTHAHRHILGFAASSAYLLVVLVAQPTRREHLRLVRGVHDLICTIFEPLGLPGLIHRVANTRHSVSTAERRLFEHLLILDSDIVLHGVTVSAQEVIREGLPCR